MLIWYVVPITKPVIMQLVTALLVTTVESQPAGTDPALAVGRTVNILHEDVTAVVPDGLEQPTPGVHVTFAVDELMADIVNAVGTVDTNAV
jgi:hypothetical protein